MVNGVDLGRTGNTYELLSQCEQKECNEFTVEAKYYLWKHRS
jgi:hypothetical protein